VAAVPGGAAALAAAAGDLARQPGAWALGAGTAAGVLLFRPLLRRFPVLETFEHELTHALAAVCLLRGVRRFKVTLHRGGYVEHAGGSRFGDDLIGLAPYLLPTLTLGASVFAPAVPAAGRAPYLAAVGVTFGYHLVSTVREVRGSFTKRSFRAAGSRRATRSDIGSRGYLYSSAVILAGILLTHGLAAALFAGGSAGVASWGRALRDGTLAAGAMLAALAR
jgi:hypothetical protein